MIRQASKCSRCGKKFSPDDSYDDRLSLYLSGVNMENLHNPRLLYLKTLHSTTVRYLFSRDTEVEFGTVRENPLSLRERGEKRFQNREFIEVNP